MVGSSSGKFKGAATGRKDEGDVEGLEVGVVEGTMVGFTLGGKGEWERGRKDGDAVGAPDGVPEGYMVGPDDTDGVGTVVGVVDEVKSILGCNEDVGVGGVVGE